MDPVSAYIDIFTKLLIAFVGLVAPLTSYLLTNYSEREKKIKRMYEAFKAEVEADHLNRVNMPNANVAALSRKSTDLLAKIEKEEANDLRYIEPKPNIIALFLSLFASLFFIIVDVFFRKDYFHTIYPYNHCTSVFFLLISLSLLVYAIRRIYKIVVAYIETKRQIDNYEGENSIQQGN